MRKGSQKILSVLAAASMMVTSFGMAVSAAEAAKSTTLKLLFTNDTHARYADSVEDDGTLSQFGYARLQTLIKQQSASVGGNSLLLDVGDAFHGQSFATTERGAGIARVFRAMGYDAMVAGNHDFNYGVNQLSPLTRFARIDLLGANVIDKKTGGIYNLFKEYEMYNVGGVNVAVFGLSTPETAYKTNPKNVENVRFADPVKTAQQVVDKIKKNEKADVIVCLAHLGIVAEKEQNSSTYLAQNVKGIDVILDGHSHTAPGEYKTINDTAVISAGSYSEYLGDVTVTVTGDDVQVKTAAHAATSYTDKSLPPDPDVLGIIRATERFQGTILNKTVGSAPEKLVGERGLVRTGETNLSKLITDAMINETGADIALTNGGGIRASIDAGSITAKEIVDVLPFGNYIVTIKLTGAELKSAVEHGLPSMVGGKLEEIGKCIQFSGMNVTYNPSAPAGKRIVSITRNGKPVADTDTFIVATNDFMNVGGDDYTMLKKPVINEYSALDEALIKYMSKGAAAIQKVNSEKRLVIAQ